MIILMEGAIIGSFSTIAIAAASYAFGLWFWNAKARKRNTRIHTGDALWRELAAKRAAAK